MKGAVPKGARCRATTGLVTASVVETVLHVSLEHIVRCTIIGVAPTVRNLAVHACGSGGPLCINGFFALLSSRVPSYSGHV